MAPVVFSYLQNLWPFSILKSDDLKASICLVRSLSIPDQIKQFVFAVREADSHAVVYILAAQNLSEQSIQDTQDLIKEVQPEAVVVQVALSTLSEIQAEERNLRDDQANNVPTSSFEVLKRCLINKVNKDQYDNFARRQILREIFGIGLYDHVLAAKRVAEEVESNFILLESPYENACNADPPGKVRSGGQSSGLHFETHSLLSGKIAPAVNSNSWRFCVTDGLQSQMVKSISPFLDSSISKACSSPYASGPEPEPRCNYQAPPFAQPVYPLLVDLHDIFHDLPAMGKALASAQKMLSDVNDGEPVDTQILAEVQNFRIAVEGLRIALNNAARCPIDKMLNGNLTRMDFSELPSEEKCHALFAQALRNQVRKYGTVVAIVDASSLGGLRRHWDTSLPVEVADLADQCFTHYFCNDLDSNDEAVIENEDSKRWLFGAGATAVLGASSLSKAVNSSVLFKLATYKFPASFKFGIAHLQRTAAMGLSKILGPSKLIAPKVASVGAKTSMLKLSASAEKIRAVVHGMIASAERTSLMAIRTSFYEIMRRRGVMPIRIVPWATFGCSVATCAGLVTYGDGIECAAEAFPSVPTIASMGRGLQSLHRASLEVKQTSGKRIPEALKSLMCNLKK